MALQFEAFHRKPQALSGEGVDGRRQTRFRLPALPINMRTLLNDERKTNVTSPLCISLNFRRTARSRNLSTILHNDLSILQRRWPTVQLQSGPTHGRQVKMNSGHDYEVRQSTSQHKTSQFRNFSAVLLRLAFT